MEVSWLVLGVMLATSAANLEEVNPEPSEEAFFGTSDYILTYAVIVSGLLITVVAISTVRKLQRNSSPTNPAGFPLMDIRNQVGEYEEIRGDFNQKQPIEVEPQYEEIKEGLRSAPPPSLHGRRTKAEVVRRAPPKKVSPPQHEEPEYIIPDAPDDSVNPDGYLKPLGRSQ